MMNTKSILTLLALVAWILFCNWWWCNHQPTCSCAGNSAQVATTPASDDAVIRFNSNNFSPVTGNGWSFFKDSIVNLLKKGKRVEITGFYGSKETNATSFENLGLARADTIKNILMSQVPGISANHFSLLSKLNTDVDNATSPFVASAIQVRDTVATPSENGGVVVQDSNNVIIYFPSGSSNKEPSKEVDNYLKTLGTRLKTSTQSVTISGYTDNKGNAQKNVELSLERAKFVKNILIKNGAVADKLLTEGKGDKEPIGDNATDAGRRQNRRVQIKIN